MRAVERVIGGSGDDMKMRRRDVAVSPPLSLSSALLPPPLLSTMYVQVYIREG